MSILDANGVRIHYLVNGIERAPVLLLLHSLGSNLHMWDPQMPALRTHLHIVRFDIRGHGRSDAPPGPYTLDELGADAVALLDELEINRFHLCGLSLGGMLALWLAANHPQRVERAVFADTAARIGSVDSWQARIDAVQAGGMGAVREAVLERFLSDDYRRKYPHTTQEISDVLTETNADGYRGCCAALRDADLHERVASIRAPSLIITGELDESTPPTQAEELHALIAGSELAVIAGASHLSNIERRDEFTRLLLEFLL